MPLAPNPLRTISLLVGSLVAAACASGAVQLAAPFSDHAILQREKPIRVWGSGSPGEKITASFGSETQQVAADPAGAWHVIFTARPANRVGTDLVVTGENTITVRDILVGEVWLCSGQSNMTFPLERSEGGTLEIAAANFPLIRQFTVTQTTAGRPAATVAGAWRICSPATAGRFTAVGYYFARELLQDLDVPIGLMHCAWGGTPIESWMSAPVLEQSPASAAIARRWQDDLSARPANQAAYDRLLKPWLDGDAAAQREGAAAAASYRAAHPRPTVPSNIRPSSAPSSLYNGMLHPLIPYTLRGILWYQGEGNTGRPEEYSALFAALITSWRKDFKQGDIPFYWVNLANFKGNEATLGFARLREAQTQTLTLPNTGQALAIDIGNHDDIHPTNKRDVGHRLALIAKAKTYGRSGEFSGPQFANATVRGQAMRVTFTHAAGLSTRGGAPGSLEIAGADKKFHPATGTIEGETLLVSAPEVPAPVAVRYAFRNSPEANLYNGAGLPAVPFRSDSW